MTEKKGFPKDTPLNELGADQLFARMAHAHLYLIEMKAVEGLNEAPTRSIQTERLRYLYKLEQEGRLYGFGPVAVTAIRPAYDLAIIAAASTEQAERIATSEPLHKAGLCCNTVRTHMINEGVACYIGRALAHRAQIPGNSFDPDWSGVSLSYEELTSRAVGARLHLVQLSSTAKLLPAENMQPFIEHFIWLRDHEMKAKLMTCGPVDWTQPPISGIWGGGMGVFATSMEETKAIAAQEPSGRMGYRSLSVFPWTLDYGLAAPVGKALTAINQLSS